MEELGCCTTELQPQPFLFALFQLLLLLLLLLLFVVLELNLAPSDWATSLSLFIYFC